MRKYYNDELHRRDHRINAVTNACLERIKLLSTLYEERIKLGHLLERLTDGDSKPKDSSLPRKMIDLQSQISLLLPSLPIEKTSPKISPPITSPPLSLPNNSRADGLNLLGNKNRGEGVSEGGLEDIHS